MFPGLLMFFSVLGKQMPLPALACPLQPGKAWIFRDFGRNYCRGLCWGLAVGEPGHGAVAAAPAGRSIVPATGKLPSWVCITAPWRRRDLPSLWVPSSCCCFVNEPSKFELHCCCRLVRGLLAACRRWTGSSFFLVNWSHHFIAWITENNWPWF